jgi:hypothetical protein
MLKNFLEDGQLIAPDTALDYYSNVSNQNMEFHSNANQHGLVDLYGDRASFICCKNPRENFNSYSGEIFESICRLNTCLACVRRFAPMYSKMIEIAGPSQFITITGFINDRALLRTAFTSFRRNLKRATGEDPRYAWVAEENVQSRDKAHIHSWMYCPSGAVLNPESLNAAAQRSGLGHVHMSLRTRSSTYSYLTKVPAHNQASLQAHTRLNGREIINGRRFWRDGRGGSLIRKPEAKWKARQSLPQNRHIRNMQRDFVDLNISQT